MKTTIVGVLLAMSLTVGGIAQNGPKGAKWRAIDGIVENIEDWDIFSGEITQVDKDGLLVSGRLFWDGYDRKTFWLRNYPFAVVDGDQIRGVKVKMVGAKQYVSVLGAATTVRMLDYGIPALPPPPPPLTPAQAAQKAMAEINRQTEKTNAAARLLKWHQDQAEKGSPSAQCSLGLRYLHGDGVPQDETLARAWLQKAASQNNPEAIATMEKLPAKPTHSAASNSPIPAKVP